MSSGSGGDDAWWRDNGAMEIAEVEVEVEVEAEARSGKAEVEGCEVEAGEGGRRVEK